MAENLYHQQNQNNNHIQQQRIQNLQRNSTNQNQNLHYQEAGMDSLLRENGKFI